MGHLARFFELFVAAFNPFAGELNVLAIASDDGERVAVGRIAVGITTASGILSGSRQKDGRKVTGESSTMTGGIGGSGETGAS